VARIDWILKPNGPGQMGDVISHQPGVIRAVNRTAHELAAIAKGNLEAHRSESDEWGHAYIDVTRGDVDSFVNLKDERSQLAAAAIEFGNKYGGGGVAPLRNAIGSMRFKHGR
jgi:hypothetical protein